LRQRLIAHRTHLTHCGYICRIRNACNNVVTPRTRRLRGGICGASVARLEVRAAHQMSGRGIIARYQEKNIKSGGMSRKKSTVLQEAR